MKFGNRLILLLVCVMLAHGTTASQDNAANTLNSVLREYVSSIRAASAPITVSNGSTKVQELLNPKHGDNPDDEHGLSSEIDMPSVQTTDGKVSSDSKIHKVINEVFLSYLDTLRRKNDTSQSVTPIDTIARKLSSTSTLPPTTLQQSIVKKEERGYNDDEDDSLFNANHRINSATSYDSLNSSVSSSDSNGLAPKADYDSRTSTRKYKRNHYTRTSTDRGYDEEYYKTDRSSSLKEYDEDDRFHDREHKYRHESHYEHEADTYRPESRSARQRRHFTEESERRPHRDDRRYSQTDRVRYENAPTHQRSESFRPHYHRPDDRDHYDHLRDARRNHYDREKAIDDPNQPWISELLNHADIKRYNMIQPKIIVRVENCPYRGTPYNNAIYNDQSTPVNINASGTADTLNRGQWGDEGSQNGVLTPDYYDSSDPQRDSYALNSGDHRSWVEQQTSKFENSLLLKTRKPWQCRCNARDNSPNRANYPDDDYSDLDIYNSIHPSSSHRSRYHSVEDPAGASGLPLPYGRNAPESNERLRMLLLQGKGIQRLDDVNVALDDVARRKDTFRLRPEGAPWQTQPSNDYSRQHEWVVQDRKSGENGMEEWVLLDKAMSNQIPHSLQSSVPPNVADPDRKQPSAYCKVTNNRMCCIEPSLEEGGKRSQHLRCQNLT